MLNMSEKGRRRCNLVALFGGILFQSVESLGVQRIASTYTTQCDSSVSSEMRTSTFGLVKLKIPTVCQLDVKFGASKLLLVTVEPL